MSIRLCQTAVTSAHLPRTRFTNSRERMKKIKIAGSLRSEMETNCAAPSLISPFYQQCNAILLLHFGYLENDTLFFDIWLFFFALLGRSLTLF